VLTSPSAGGKKEEGRDAPLTKENEVDFLEKGKGEGVSFLLSFWESSEDGTGPPNKIT